MSISQRQDQIIAEFRGITDWEARYKKIIEIGKSLPELPAELKQESHLVKGCQSQVWLYADLVDGRVVFRADSDALLVRGLIALVLRLYSNATPDEVLAEAPRFVGEIGLANKLTPSRANGLLAMIKQVKFYALALKARC